MAYNYNFEGYEKNKTIAPEDKNKDPKYAELKTNPVYNEEGGIIKPAFWIDDPNQQYEEEQPRRRGR